MKFNFKIQQYQTDAVDAVIKAFNGQSYHKNTGYIRDLGSLERPVNVQISFIDEDEVDIYDDTGFKNDELDITDSQLLANIQKLQKDNNIKVSPSLVKDLGRCSLDIEMETGTGKTYVYIKTMFELNKRYGWTKFIVVVPSIAIREGVKKSFEITSDHFMEHYGKRARFFVYNSSNLTQLDNFSSDGGINVMIINTQAFASSMKEDGKSKVSLYDEPSSFFTFADIFRALLILLTFCTTSNNLALPGIPYCFNDGETARQIVFSVRLLSATTRFVVKASKFLSLHSTEA